MGVLAAASVGPQVVTGTVSPDLTSLSLSARPKCAALGVAAARSVLQGASSVHPPANYMPHLKDHPARKRE
jgi:hypothetical protein